MTHYAKRETFPMQCPHCAAKLTIKEARRGEQGDCPKCGTMIAIPLAPNDPDESTTAGIKMFDGVFEFIATVVVSLVSLVLAMAGFGCLIIGPSSGSDVGSLVAATQQNTGLLCWLLLLGIWILAALGKVTKLLSQVLLTAKSK